MVPPTRLRVTPFVGSIGPHGNRAGTVIDQSVDRPVASGSGAHALQGALIMSRRSPSPLLVAASSLAVIALLTVPTAARASTCTAYPTHVLPNEDTPAVPTNTRIWYVGQAMQYVLSAGTLTDCDAPPQLLDADGGHVPTTTRSFSFAHVLVPDAPLVRGATYHIEHACLFDHVAFADAIDSETTTFVVTAEADEAPPKPPELAIGDAVATEYENGFVGHSMAVEGEFEGILLVDIGREATLDPDALTGEVALVSTDTNFVIGHDCVPTWPDAQPGSSTTVAFASFDLAGNFSGWTEPEPLEIEAQGCARCSTGSSRSAAAPVQMLAMLALGLFVRRRRPHPRAQCHRG